MRKIKWTFPVLVIFASALLFKLAGGARADVIGCQNLDNPTQCYSDKIAEYEEKISSLTKAANTLSNQIAQFNTQIDLTILKISQTEEKIALLGGRIDSLATSLASLTASFNSRAVETYKMARFGDPVLVLISSPNLTEAVLRFHYLEKIQEADRDLLGRLTSAQTDYKNQKTEQEKLQEELTAQKASLDSQKAAKAQLLAVTQNDEKKYQELLAEAKAQLAAFQKFVSSQGGASILQNQTKCDSWGCYYNQRDAEWGNMTIGSSDSTMAQVGCLITSVAMVATHYGKQIKPSNIAALTSPFFSSTAYMIYPSWSGAGISVTRTSVTPMEANIDSEVNSGRPVIAGLYGSFSEPEHFIVIKSKDSRGYIMNDPFLENGGDRPLTDKYSFGNIVRVDKVTIN
jgi:peptidoglycan hydrolase CwlO-like protein